jgi:antitoxin component YwqK of YwqJK toxin-antitoxin module
MHRADTKDLMMLLEEEYLLEITFYSNSKLLRFIFYSNSKLLWFIFYSNSKLLRFIFYSNSKLLWFIFYNCSKFLNYDWMESHLSLWSCDKTYMSCDLSRMILLIFWRFVGQWHNTIQVKKDQQRKQ